MFSFLLRRAVPLAAAVTFVQNNHQRQPYYFGNPPPTRTLYCMDRAQVPKAPPQYNDNPLQVRLFQDTLLRHPELSRALTGYTQEGNAWVLATTMHYHDNDDRNIIMDNTMSMFPERTREQARHRIEQGLHTIYRMAPRVPDITDFPQSIRT